MSIQKISRATASTSHWSGGTTTEFYIDPPDKSYANRDFAIRISSATVDLAESDFTLVQGYQRIITPLQGGFTLTFPEDGNRQVTLAPLEESFFDGSWHTHSVGKAVDFNVMYKKGMSAAYKRLKGSQTLPPSQGHRFLYVPLLPEEQLQGASIGSLPLERDTLYVLSPDEGPVPVQLPAGAEVIFVEVKD